MIRDTLKRRHMSIRRRIAGTPERPRLCIKRSNRYIYVMLVDDSRNRVLTGISSQVAEVREKKLKRTEAAKEVGPNLFFALLIIVVSFLPIFVLGEQSGRLFKPPRLAPV